ncbi:hypothetical protein SAMN06298221_11845 [Sphaerochaeta associata]|uniref:Uncharacterized protein n=1 Tax=Sphaerochaeta associata TaxID=1129264 RepID=A0ABY4D884_9SPIR|nr:hypothetical protein [Sphaerochaeta associata]UOM50125.1 hypothetical protein MUG09_11225 [Sphaerochaeta associata]SMP65070.1 hypothetical protein SAMN06298221_11845 [Sphaerochaeta associata]
MAEEIKSREDLYSAVWSKPMMKLAEEFGISGRGLAKLCERLKVPVPPRGYWRKVSLGQSIKKIPLPEVEFTRYELWKNQSSLDDLERRRKAEKERSAIFNNPEIEIKDKEIQEIVSKTLQAEQTRKTMMIVSEQDITSPMVKKFLLSQTRNKTALPSNTNSSKLAIDVTESCALRAGLLMETLLQCFKGRRWDFSIEKEDVSPHARMFVNLFGQRIYFAIIEPVTNKRFPLTEKERKAYEEDHHYGRVPKYRYIPTATSRLLLSINDGKRVYQSWEDRGKQLIEASIKEIMLGFIYVAIQSSNETILALEREQRLKLEQARKLEEERLKRLDAKRYEKLIADSEAYSQMKKIQNYVEYVKNQAQDQAAEPDSEISKWMEWAQSKINDLNPLKNGLPKFSIDEHRENIINPSVSFLDDLFRDH